MSNETEFSRKMKRLAGNRAVIVTAVTLLVVAGVVIAATVYSIWLFYAADPKYLLFGAIALLPGLIPYVGTRLYRREQVFNAFEWGVLVLLVVAAGFGAVGLISGGLTL